MRTDHPRDLVMTGAIFGLATFIWAGWAQEQPPGQWVWRLVLAVLGAAGLALIALNLPLAIRNWKSGTAIERRSRGFVVYIVVLWVEIAVAIGLATWLTSTGHADEIAPMILAIVGVHFFALAPVFKQPALYLLAVLLTAVAVVAALVPGVIAAHSFWSGAVAAALFLVVGTWSGLAGRKVLRRAESA